MRYGFTTGSCAAAAAKAAAFMLLSGKEKNQIEIETPKGISFRAEVADINRSENQVSCAVQKDGGDDPDVTTGLWICATVSFRKQEKDEADRIWIDGAKGIGRVTLPGLDQPVGNAAINSVPRAMIRKEVTEVMELLDYRGSLSVILSVEHGEEVAQNTFNPRLGIEGGISILGTSGIVEPMSEQALVDTIQVELNQKKALGMSIAVVAPGNYGLDFMQRRYHYDLDRSVKCSNFIGQTVDLAVECGFERMLLVGHIGKLIKVAGGIMNTHSRFADGRMEILTAHAAMHDFDNGILSQVMQAVTTEEGIRILQEYSPKQCEQTMRSIAARIQYHLQKHANGKIQAETIMFSNEFGLLAATELAEAWIKSED